MELAPIIFFAYNRPKHTLQSLEALMSNELADQSTLYIFCDGPKDNSDGEKLNAILETRKVIREKQWCKTVKIFESEKNQGLAKSIIHGITHVINLHGKIIVIEDDIFTSPYFLRYMNDGLNLFEDRKDIGSINGFAVDFLAKNKFPQYFLINNADCWGWATWKNRWDNYIFDAQILKNRLHNENKVKLFEYGGHMQILDAQIEGHVDTWDVQWHATHILNNQKGVFAKIPFIDNIGLDGSGVHYNTVPEKEPERVKLNDYKIPLPDFVSIKPLVYSEQVEKKFRKHYIRYFKMPVSKRIINFGNRVKNKILKTIKP